MKVECNFDKIDVLLR